MITFGNRDRPQQPEYADDLDNMAVPRYRLGRHWMREYHRNFPISDPEEDYEDRNTVYAMYVASTLAIMCLGLISSDVIVEGISVLPVYIQTIKARVRCKFSPWTKILQGMILSVPTGP